MSNNQEYDNSYDNSPTKKYASEMKRIQYSIPLYVYRKPKLNNKDETLINITSNDEPSALSEEEENQKHNEEQNETPIKPAKKTFPYITKLLKIYDRQRKKKTAIRIEEAFYKTTRKFENAVNIDRTNTIEYSEVIKGQKSLLSNLRNPLSFMNYKKRLLRNVISNTQINHKYIKKKLKLHQNIKEGPCSIERSHTNISDYNSSFPSINSKMRAPIVYFYKVDDNKTNNYTMKSLLEHSTSDNVNKVNRMIVLSTLMNSHKKDPFSETFVAAYKTLDINPSGMCTNIRKQMKCRHKR